MSGLQTGRILLVEDNTADVLLVREALAQHEVAPDLIVAGDGEQAIQFVNEVESRAAPYPDLVILDLNLPKRQGTEVLRRIRENDAWNRVPVVVLTSSDAPQDRDESTKLGVNLYVLKPGDLAEFLEIGAMLKSILQRQDNRRDGSCA